jgi:OOP family OmpA-OmpF porin
MSNILDSVRDYLSPELLGEAANIYGENEAGIAKAIGSLAPTILAGLLEKSGDSHAIDNIFSTLRNFNPAILDNLGSLLGGGNLSHNDPKDDSGRLLSVIFGAKVPAITNAVASFSGIKQSSASSLLGLAGPLVMALLNKKISAEGLNASKLVGYLLSQRNTIVSLLPAGVGSLLGMANAGHGNTNQGKASIGMGWVWSLLLLLGLGVAIIYFLNT